MDKVWKFINILILISCWTPTKLPRCWGCTRSRSIVGAATGTEPSHGQKWEGESGTGAPTFRFSRRRGTLVGALHQPGPLAPATLQARDQLTEPTTTPFPTHFLEGKDEPQSRALFEMGVWAP